MGLCGSQWDIFLINGWCGTAQPIVVIAFGLLASALVVLDTVRKQAEKPREQASNLFPPWPLPQLPSPGSCPDFCVWWTFLLESLLVMEFITEETLKHMFVFILKYILTEVGHGGAHL